MKLSWRALLTNQFGVVSIGLTVTEKDANEASAHFAAIYTRGTGVAHVPAAAMRDRDYRAMHEASQ